MLDLILFSSPRLLKSSLQLLLDLSVSLSLFNDSVLDEVVIRIELLSGVHIVIDHSESGGSASSEFSLESVNNNILVLGLVNFSEL